jgi:Domain of unknown function (DUF4248)
MEESFKIKAYGYGELAQLYFPHITKKSASAQLSKWIWNDTQLKAKLEARGFTKNSRRLKPVYVEIIVTEIGYP